MFRSQPDKMFDVLGRPGMEGQVIQSGKEAVMGATFSGW
jgi:hypothetical protein